MKNNNKKIIILSLFILISSFFLNQKVEASSVLLKPSNTVLGIGEQFYLDVMLNTEGKVINGFNGSINIPLENVSFIRAEEGGSMINLWVEKPALKGNIITFSGIIPNGFGGVIDPFSPKERLPGLMIRLIFETEKEGEVSLLSSDSYATLNDGLGTLDTIADNITHLTIQKVSNNFIYKSSQKDTNPELSVFVVRDPNLFNNKYTLIFDARDEKTGIKEVLIKEGKRDWKKIESPYLLEDQSRHSIITIQATNYSDSSIVMSVEGIPSKILSFKNIIVVLLFIILLLFVSKKLYEKYKKVRN